MPGLVRDPQSGDFLTYDEAAQAWRPLTGEEHGSLTPRKVLDEQGILDSERFTFKNLTESPDTAVAYLRLLKNPDGSRKYDVFRYGRGFQAAVRPAGRKDLPFKLVDPAKGSLGELWRDITDLSVADILVPLGVGAATVSGGGVASVLTGAAAGAGLEGARLAAGRAAGVPQGIDPLSVGVAGAVGGAVPIVGRALGAAVRGPARALASGLGDEGLISRFGRGFLEKVTGMKPLANEDIMTLVLEKADAIERPVLRPFEGAKIFQGHMDQIAGPRIERLITERNGLIPVDHTVNIRPQVQELMAILRKRRAVLAPEELALDAKSKAEAVATAKALALLKQPTREGVTAALRAAHASEPSESQINAAFRQAVEDWLHGLEQAPTRSAVRLKQVIDEYVSARGGFRTARAAAPGAVEPAQERAIRTLARFRRQYDTALRGQLDKSGLGRVNEINGQLSGMIRARNAARRRFGEEFPGRGEKNLVAAFEKGGHDLRQILKDYDAAFPGTDIENFLLVAAGKIKMTGRLIESAEALAGLPSGGIESISRQAAAGLRFTPNLPPAARHGLPSVVPRLFSTGQVAQVPMLTAGTGGLLGLAFGGPAGAALGGSLGFILAAPKTAVRVAAKLGGKTGWAEATRRAAQGVADLRIPALVAGTARSAAWESVVAAARAERGRTLARQDRRKLRFTGQ